MKFEEGSGVLPIGQSSTGALASRNVEANQAQREGQSSQSSDWRVGALLRNEASAARKSPQSRRVKQGMNDHASRRDPAIGRDVESLSRSLLREHSDGQVWLFRYRHSSQRAGRENTNMEPVLCSPTCASIMVTFLAISVELETWTIIETMLETKRPACIILTPSSCSGPCLLHQTLYNHLRCTHTVELTYNDELLIRRAP